MGWNYLSIAKHQRAAIEVWEWISNFIPHFTKYMIKYPFGIHQAFNTWYHPATPVFSVLWCGPMWLWHARVGFPIDVDNVLHWQQYLCLQEEPMVQFNILSMRQNGRHFANIFKCNFFGENGCILNNILLKFISSGPVNIKPALVQIMACCLFGTKPLSDPMMA